MEKIKNQGIKSMKARTKCSRKLISFIICMTLTMAMALSITGCMGNEPPSGAIEEVNVQTAGKQAEITQLGEGGVKFTFTVVDKDGGEAWFEIHTDKETVGEALLELELIDGDESVYGLFVKTVNGIDVDYDKDGAYWAFYVDDEYAQTGVDVTEVREGASYAFKVE